MEDKQIGQNKKENNDWKETSSFFNLDISKKSKGTHKIKLNADNKEYEETADSEDLTEVKKTKITASEVRMLNKLREKKIEEVFNEFPKPKEYIHLVSAGAYDYFKLIQRVLELKGGEFTLYASTWTMNYVNVDALLNFIKVGRIKECTMLVGDYLRQREPLVFETLKQGLYESNKGRIKAFKNHCKIICMSNGIDYFVSEGSANFTSNPRTEQHILTNNKELYDFHTEWMNELFTINKDGKDRKKKD